MASFMAVVENASTVTIGALHDHWLAHMAVQCGALFGSVHGRIVFDAGELREPTDCLHERLGGYVFIGIAVIVTERIVKIPD